MIIPSVNARELASIKGLDTTMKMHILSTNGAFLKCEILLTEFVSAPYIFLPVSGWEKDINECVFLVSESEMFTFIANLLSLYVDVSR